MRCCGGCCYCFCCCCCYFGVQPFRFPAPHTHTHSLIHKHTLRRPLRSLFNSNKISLTAPFAQGTMRILHILIPSRIRQVPQRLMSCSWSFPLFERCTPRPDQSYSRAQVFTVAPGGSEFRMCIAIAIGRQLLFSCPTIRSR